MSTIRIFDDETGWVEVPGTTRPSGLGVHQCPPTRGMLHVSTYDNETPVTRVYRHIDRWAVTHLASGRCVLRATSEEAANVAAGVLEASAVDWTATASDVGAHPDVYQAHLDAVAATHRLVQAGEYDEMTETRRPAAR